MQADRNGSFVNEVCRLSSNVLIKEDVAYMSNNNESFGDVLC